MKRNKRVYLSFVFLLIVLVVGAACQSNDVTTSGSSESGPISEPATGTQADDATVAGGETAVSPSSEPEITDTAEPEFEIIETLSADIGAEGGTLSSTDGAIELLFPPEALSETTTVAVILREAVPADGAVLSPVLEISLTPELAEPLAIPAVLIFHDRGEEGVQYGRLVTMLGSVNAPEEDAITYWQPLDYTHVNEEGGLQLLMADFSTYAVLDELPDDCSDVSLSPPTEAPDEYAYVGRKIIVNKTFTKAWMNQITTVPPIRAGSSNDELVVQQQAMGGCGQITAVDIYTPITATEIPSLPEMCAAWQAPGAPSGYQLYSAKIFANGVLSETIQTDAPEPLPEADIPVIIMKDSGQTANEQACSGFAIYAYVPRPSAVSTAMDSPCIPDESLLESSYEPLGYDYVGYNTVINDIYISDLSTAPLGRMPRLGDIINPVTGYSTRDGVRLCDYGINHIFEQPRDEATSLAPVSFAQTELPGPIDGYTYQGYFVTVNGESNPDWAMLPPMPDNPGDFHLDRSYYSNSVLGGDTITSTDYIGSLWGDASLTWPDDAPVALPGHDPITAAVVHVYKPANQGSCSIPDELLMPPEIPPCTRYVGVEVVVNKELDEERSTVPSNREPQKTDTVRIHSRTTVIDSATKCDIIVMHVFKAIACAPAVITATVDLPPYTYDTDFYTNFYFPAGSNLSMTDRAFLASISIMPPIENENGGLSVALPLGTEMTAEDNQITIQVPQK